MQLQLGCGSIVAKLNVIIRGNTFYKYIFAKITRAIYIYANCNAYIIWQHFG